MRKHRLVFLDIDGTILDSSRRISASTQSACQSAVANGHKLLLCSGRSLPEIVPRLFSALGITGVIASGGCYASVNHNVLLDHRIGSDVIEPTSRWFDSIGASYVWQSSDSINPSENFFDTFLGKIGVANTEIGQTDGDWSSYQRQVMPYLHEGLPQTSSKVTFLIPHGVGVTLSDCDDQFGHIFDVIMGSIQTGSSLSGEMVPRGFSKGSALQKVARHCDIPIQDTVAFGDSDNDLDMLASAGVGVAMGNSADHVKKVADRVTTSNDADGIARGFSDLGLI